MADPTKFFGLLREFGLLNRTGEKAGAALRGPEVQKAGDLLNQIKDANRVGARPGALAVVRGALEDADPTEMIRKQHAAALLGRPMTMARVENKRTALPERHRTTYGWDDASITDEQVDDLVNQRHYERAREDANDALSHEDADRLLEQHIDQYGIHPLEEAAFWRNLVQRHLQENGLRGGMAGTSFLPEANTIIFGAPSMSLDVAPLDRVRELTQALESDPRTLYQTLQHYGTPPRVAARLSANLRGAGYFGDDPWWKVAQDQRALYLNRTHNQASENFLQRYLDDFDPDGFYRQELERGVRDHLQENRSTTGPWGYEDIQRIAPDNGLSRYTEQNVFAPWATGARLSQSTARHARGQLPQAQAEDINGRGFQYLYEGAAPYRPDPDAMKRWTMPAGMAGKPGDLPLASHFMEGFTPLGFRNRYVGHMRGTLMPDMGAQPHYRHALPPGFYVEELQSDLAQQLSRRGVKPPATLGDANAWLAAAAMHHAAEQGAPRILFPNAALISSARGGSGADSATMYRRQYDKEVPAVVQQWAQHFGQEPYFVAPSARQIGLNPDVAWNGMDLTEEMRREILEGRLPYAAGGAVR